MSKTVPLSTKFHKLPMLISDISQALVFTQMKVGQCITYVLAGKKGAGTHSTGWDISELLFIMST
jgi:hypothetical protein